VWTWWTLLTKLMEGVDLLDPAYLAQEGADLLEPLTYLLEGVDLLDPPYLALGGYGPSELFLPSSWRVWTCWTLLSMILLQRSSLSLTSSIILLSTSSSSRSTSPSTPPRPRWRLSACSYTLFHKKYRSPMHSYTETDGNIDDSSLRQRLHLYSGPIIIFSSLEIKTNIFFSPSYPCSPCQCSPIIFPFSVPPFETFHQVFKPHLDVSNIPHSAGGPGPELGGGGLSNIYIYIYICVHIPISRIDFYFLPLHVHV
jgi:hypothetical protein